MCAYVNYIIRGMLFTSTTSYCIYADVICRYSSVLLEQRGNELNASHTSIARNYDKDYQSPGAFPTHYCYVANCRAAKKDVRALKRPQKHVNERTDKHAHKQTSHAHAHARTYTHTHTPIRNHVYENAC